MQDMYRNSPTVVARQYIRAVGVDLDHIVIGSAVVFDTGAKRVAEHLRNELRDMLTIRQMDVAHELYQMFRRLARQLPQEALAVDEMAKRLGIQFAQIDGQPPTLIEPL